MIYRALYWLMEVADGERWTFIKLLPYRKAQHIKLELLRLI